MADLILAEYFFRLGPCRWHRRRGSSDRLKSVVSDLHDNSIPLIRRSAIPCTGGSEAEFPVP